MFAEDVLRAGYFADNESRSTFHCLTFFKWFVVLAGVFCVVVFVFAFFCWTHLSPFMDLSDFMRKLQRLPLS